MLKVALKSLMARKSRVLLTSLAVIVGTAFLAGTFIFTDTIRKAFDDLFADVYQNTDALVRSSNSIEAGFGVEQRDRLPESILDDVEKVDGVKNAEPFVQGFARIIGKDGEPLGTDQGPPTFGGTANVGDLSPWVLTDGSLPTGPDQVALDRGSVRNGDFALGDLVKITSAGGSREFTLTGVASFGTADSPAGSTYALFDLPTAQDFVGKPGFLDSIFVAGDGTVSDDELATRIDAALAGQGAVETLTGAEITDEARSQIRESLGFFNTFLRVFSFIGLFVSAFVIYNVFSITVAQRRQENAMLRAVGASRRQVTVALLVEALVVGVLGSLLGLLGGIALSSGLRALLGAFGVDLPSAGLALEMRTIVVTVLVGVLVTVVAAVVPALKSGRVPPVAAMRDDVIVTSKPSRSRLVFGGILGAAGLGAVLYGLSAERLEMLGLGTVALFFALFVLGPLLARPVARGLGAPIAALTGITGQMARQNAARNPKRTARTAFALLIGVALVTGVTVLASSIRSSISKIIGEQFVGDFAVTTGSFGFGGLSPDLAEELGSLPEIDVAAGIGANFAVIEGSNQFITVIDPTTAGQVFDLDFVEGRAEDLTADGVLVSTDRTETDGLSVGDTIIVSLVDGIPRPLTVQGVYANNELAGNYTVANELFEGAATPTFDFAVFMRTAPGVSDDEALASIERVVDEYGNGEVRTRQQYIDDQSAQINQLLGLLWGLLGLSIIIALIGIVITLLLSVYERRHELGLLRAVGMTKGQVRRTVRWEAVITSLFGAVQGILLGLGLGYAVVASLRDEGFNTFAVPNVGLLAVLVLAFLVGVLAAVYPAWRATRVNVVEAIATL